MRLKAGLFVTNNSGPLSELGDMTVSHPFHEWTLRCPAVTYSPQSYYHDMFLVNNSQYGRRLRIQNTVADTRHHCSWYTASLRLRYGLSSPVSRAPPDIVYEVHRSRTTEIYLKVIAPYSVYVTSYLSLWGWLGTYINSKQFLGHHYYRRPREKRDNWVGITFGLILLVELRWS